MYLSHVRGRIHLLIKLVEIGRSSQCMSHHSLCLDPWLSKGGGWITRIRHSCFLAVGTMWPPLEAPASTISSP